MTNINKPESDSSKRDVAFDGITFEVEEEEHTQEGQKVKRRGIYLWPNLITTAALLSGFYCKVGLSKCNNLFSRITILHNKITSIS